MSFLIEKIPALKRAGKNDTKFEFGFCRKDQIIRLFGQYSPQKIQIDDFFCDTLQKTPAKVAGKMLFNLGVDRDEVELENKLHPPPVIEGTKPTEILQKWKVSKPVQIEDNVKKIKKLERENQIFLEVYFLNIC